MGEWKLPNLEAALSLRPPRALSRAPTRGRRDAPAHAHAQSARPVAEAAGDAAGARDGAPPGLAAAWADDPRAVAAAAAAAVAAAGAAPAGASRRSDGAAAAASPRAGGAPAAAAASSIRVYQLLAPALVARAHVFGNRMALKPGATCLDLPYFDAPGGAMAC